MRLELDTLEATRAAEVRVSELKMESWRNEAVGAEESRAALSFLSHALLVSHGHACEWVINESCHTCEGSISHT